MYCFVGQLSTQHWQTLTHVKIATMLLTKESSDINGFIKKKENYVRTDIEVNKLTKTVPTLNYG